MILLEVISYKKSFLIKTDEELPSSFPSYFSFFIREGETREAHILSSDSFVNQYLALVWPDQNQDRETPSKSWSWVAGANYMSCQCGRITVLPYQESVITARAR